MKNHFLVRIMSLMILILLSCSLYSQEKSSSFSKGWSLNANGGKSLFYGEVDNYRFYRVFENNNEWRFGGGLMVQKQFNHYFTLRAQGLYGQLSGTKRKSGIMFEGDVIEISMSGKVDAISLFWGEKSRLMSFYAMLGIGLTQWRTELINYRTNESIGGNGNMGSGIGGRTLEPVLPFGLGIDFNINKHWTINLEGTVRPVNSDKLDAKEGGFRYDFYSYNFVGVTYKFIKKEEQVPLLPARELAVIEDEPEEQMEVRNRAVAEEQPPKVKSLEEQLLDAEARTGLYESPWPGVDFTVQVAASRSISDPALIRNKFGLSGEVFMTQGDGWYRFSVGRYIKYWKAKEYRNIMATRNQINDAFVVAYRDGERIMLYDLVSMRDTSAGGQLARAERPIDPQAFGVQVMSSKDGSISSQVIREMYDIDLEVYKEVNGETNTYRYTVGNFSSYDEAAKVRNMLRTKGIEGAFIVGYKDGKRVKNLSEMLD